MGSKREQPALLVRADGDATRGSGHLMRCTALAEAWCARGGAAFFLTRCVNETLRARIQRAGAEILPLPDDADLQTTLSSITEVNPSFVVLDGYDFHLEYQRELRSAGCRLMIIDDAGWLPRYETNVLLNQNLGAERLEYNVNSDATLLLGPQFALLRREFSVWRSRLHTVPETARKLLVTLGGSDPENVTLKVVQALRQLEMARLQIRVVAGPVNPHLSELSAAAAVFPGRLELLSHVTEMAPLMAWADIAVTAGGSTCWELACVGLPALAVVIAENQRVIAEELSAAGVVFNLGSHQEVTIDRIASSIDGLLYSTFRRLRMSERGRALVDGKGADRVAALLLQHSCIRAA
ncbi:MAG TPA: UDP-2,4-diacetamido-2,4,6-trideoxy-beta-L-altropyranose hydrolase [Candidatus Binatia bacterium]|nr:UDP-2,4-diacetamido-2,4,6-trideoxy-beta-L-altropyranose hydrolase [Candidatus Binatia bacterium]